MCFVSWFCFTALVDARSAAATFLNQAADDFEDEIASGMRAAAEHYASACGAMLPAIQAQDAFRAPWGPGFAAWDEPTRARERAILERVRACDAQAEAVLDGVLQGRRRRVVTHRSGRRDTLTETDALLAPRYRHRHRPQMRPVA